MHTVNTVITTGVDQIGFLQAAGALLSLFKYVILLLLENKLQQTCLGALM